MAKKGDRAHLEPQAVRLYADGRVLSDIAALLGVSVTSLTRWKDESKKPGAEMDEWDRARFQKRSNIQRLRDLFEDQLRHLEGLPASERTAPAMDTLSKMGSLLERWDKIEKTQAVVEAVFKDGEAAKEMTPEQLQEAIRKVYGV
jgi:ATP-dependent helicase/DNAse subunit B